MFSSGSLLLRKHFLLRGKHLVLAYLPACFIGKVIYPTAAICAGAAIRCGHLSIFLPSKVDSRAVALWEFYMPSVPGSDCWGIQPYRLSSYLLNNFPAWRQPPLDCPDNVVQTKLKHFSFTYIYSISAVTLKNPDIYTHFSWTHWNTLAKWEFQVPLSRSKW